MHENRRKLKVSIVSDSASFLTSIEDVLTKPLSQLVDLDVQAVPLLIEECPSSGSEEERLGRAINKIYNTKTDVLLIEEEVAGIAGGKIVVKLKDRGLQSSMIGVSEGVVQRRTNLSGAFVVSDTYEDRDRGIFDAIWKKGDNQELGRKIRDNAWKPLDVALIGGGGFAIRIMENILRSPDVKTIKVYSERSPVKDHKSIYEYLVENPNVSKISVEDSLDDVLRNTDVVALTSSTLRSQEVPQVVKSPDRREVLPYEVERYMRFYKAIRESEFNGLVMPLANPIHLLMYLWQHYSGNPNKVFSPLEPDTKRLSKCLRAQFLNKRYDEFIREAPGPFTGVHGMARLMSSEKWGGFIQANKGKIKRAERMADRMGKESLMAAAIFNMPAPDPAATIGRIFGDLASYKNPNVNYQIHYAHGNRNGFVSLPTKFLYKPHITVQPDMARIDEIGRRRVECAVDPFLNSQWHSVIEAISNPKQFKRQ